MDFLTDQEFNKIFDRVSKKVNLKGAQNQQEINRRLYQKSKEYRDLPGKNQ